MTTVNNGITRTQSNVVYFPEINLTMPWITDIYRHDDNQLLSRNVASVQNLIIAEEQLIDGRVPDVMRHNYGFEFPPRQIYNFDDLDSPSNNGQLSKRYMDDSYRRTYSSLFELLETYPFNYASAVRSAEKSVRNYQLEVVPRKIAEMELIQEQLLVKIDRTTEITLSDTFRNEFDQNIRAPLEAELDTLKTDSEILSAQLTEKNFNIYDELDCCSTTLGVEYNAPNFFFQKYFLRPFTLDLFNYTAWQKYAIMDVLNQGLASQKPAGDNFQLWTKNKITLQGNIRYGYFPRMGKLYFGPKRQDPQDIFGGIDEFRRWLYGKMNIYFDSIESQQQQIINTAYSESADPISSLFNFQSSEDDLTGLNLPEPEFNDFFSRFPNQFFRDVYAGAFFDFDRCSSRDNCVTYTLPINAFYFQFRLDFTTRIWRTFGEEYINVNDPRRQYQTIAFPQNIPVPLYYSVRIIRGFQVGFVIEESNNQQINTYIQWIDPNAIGQQFKLPSKTIVIQSVDNRQVYQYLRVKYGDLEERKSYDRSTRSYTYRRFSNDEDLEYKLSLRDPIDFPVVDIEFHHEPLNILNLAPVDEEAIDYGDVLPHSQNNLPAEVEIPPSQDIYDNPDTIPSDRFGLSTDLETEIVF